MLTGGAGHNCTHERSDGKNPISMRSRAGEVQSFTCPLPMRRTAFPFCWPWGHGTTNGRRDNLWEQRRCSDKQKGSSGSATTIIVQRQCRNTARADRMNHDHSSADRALCNCDVGFHWQPDQSARFSHRMKDFGLLRGLRPPKQSNLSLFKPPKAGGDFALRTCSSSGAASGLPPHSCGWKLCLPETPGL